MLLVAFVHKMCSATLGDSQIYDPALADWLQDGVSVAETWMRARTGLTARSCSLASGQA